MVISQDFAVKVVDFGVLAVDAAVMCIAGTSAGHARSWNNSTPAAKSWAGLLGQLWRVTFTDFD